MDGKEAARVAARPGSAVAIGNFDGVHVGHRQLVARALEAAGARGLRSVVLTFDRHPATVVRPASSPRLLTSVERKLELLRATGADEVVVLRFDAERAAETAEDFVRSVLVDELGARVVVVGASFRFGHDQEGDVAFLESTGRELGFEVVRVELAVGDAGEGEAVVSSSRIRLLVAEGRLEEAARLLGRPHEVCATLLSGPEPSATSGLLVLEVAPEILVPPAGVYLAELATASEVPGSDRAPLAAAVTVRPAEEPAEAGRSGCAPSASPLLGSAVHAPVELLAVPTAGGDAGQRGAKGLQPGDEVAVRFLAPGTGRAR